MKLFSYICYQIPEPMKPIIKTIVLVISLLLCLTISAENTKDYIVVTEHGVCNDGTPIGTELNDLIVNSYGGTLYFPSGRYNLTEPIVTPFDYDKNVNLIFDKNAHITSDLCLDALVMVGFTEFNKISVAERDLREFSFIEGGHFDASNTLRGIWVNGLKQLVTLKDMSIYYCKGRHIEISCTNHFRGTGSSDTKIMNVSIQGDSSNEDNYGVYIGPRCGDCKISDTFVYGTGTGLYTEGAGHIVNNFHILTWRVGEGKKGDYSNTVGIKIARQGFYEFNEVYFDTTNRDFVIEGNISVQMIVDKCISHSWIPDFGESFLSWSNMTGESRLEAKISNCVFNLDYKPENFKIFDLPDSLILNDYDFGFTFHDNIIRSKAKLNPYDLSLLMKFDDRQAECVFEQPQEISESGVVIGMIAPSTCTNELEIKHGDGKSTYLIVESDGTVIRNKTKSKNVKVEVVKIGGYSILVMKSKYDTMLFPVILDKWGNSTYMSTPSKHRKYTLEDYML